MAIGLFGWIDYSLWSSDNGLYQTVGVVSAASLVAGMPVWAIGVSLDRQRLIDIGVGFLWIGVGVLLFLLFLLVAGWVFHGSGGQVHMIPRHY
jgi:hypothetical protein